MMETIKKNGLLNHVRIKQNNQKRILMLIQENDGISRAEIAKQLDLSKPAVSSHVSELLTTNIIFEDGTNDSNGGRRAVMIKYNSNFGTYISISIKLTRIKIMYFDLKGKLIFKNSFKIDLKTKNPQQVLGKAEDCLLKDIEKLGLMNIVYLVISFPGIIKDNKILVSNSCPLFNNCDVFSYFKNFPKSKLFLINDMNLKVTGMHDMFSYARYKNIVYLNHEANGIGAGLFINGKVYEGSQKSAGEVGLMLNIKEEFPTDRIEDALISYEEILSKAANIKDIDDLNELQSLISDEKIINTIAQYYSVIINNFSVIIDPDVVILGGLLHNLGENFLKKLKEYIEQISIISINVIISDFDNEAEIHGLRVIANQYINKKIIDFIY